MHLVKAFTQLHVRKIPNGYILKQYARDARSFVEWDRNDMQKGGQDGNREDMRFAKLVPVVMDITRTGTKFDYACEEAYEKVMDLRALIESIPVNVTKSVPRDNGGADVNVDGNLTVAIAAPPLSQTKGRGRGSSNIVSEAGDSGIHTSTYKRKRTVEGQEVIGSHSYGVCGLKGNYLTTCPRNPNRSRTVEKRELVEVVQGKENDQESEGVVRRCHVTPWTNKTFLTMWMRIRSE
jgi:hypothetical protein